MSADVPRGNLDEMSLPKISKDEDGLVDDLQKIRAQCSGVDPIMMMGLLQELRESESLMTIDEVIEVINDYCLGRNEGVPIRVDLFLIIAQYSPRNTLN